MAQIIIPQTNPVKYVPFQLNTGIEGMRLHDRYNFSHLPASFERNSFYAQKWVKGIPIRQQIAAQNVALVFLQIVNCSGTVLSTLQPSSASLIGYLVDGIAYNILQFDYDTNAVSTEDVFYFILNYGPDSSNLKKEISEPQMVWQSQQPDYVVFKYSNSFNEYNTIFKTSYNSYFNQTFFFCVEGRAHEHKPEGTFVDYDDQKLNRTLLSAKPFDSWQFTIGGKDGVPEWVGSVLNMIRSCNTVYADEYQISFFEKWENSQPKFYRRGLYTIRFAKAQTEYARFIDVCEPVAVNGFAPPDADEGRPYIYTIPITGSKPFQLGALTKPSWMNVSIIDDTLYLQTIGNTYPAAPATDVEISIVITNPCGTVTLEDTINVNEAIACIAPGFTGANIYPQPVFGQLWSAFIPLNGSAPFSIDNVIKPSWLTITPTSSGILMEGTPTLSGSFTVAFNITNCAGIAGVLTYYEVFNVASNITVTGYNSSFSVVNPAQSGQIFAAPGTLVTIQITATGGGPIPPHTYTLNVSVTGASLSQPLNVTNGSLSATFVMPASGFVGWSGTFNGSNAAGGATMTVS